ncbi:MAG: dihydroorotase, partial [Acidimicrobiia bacterium]|nr:dihydroorotase [Acidimicrobiia bacterium]
AIVAMPNTIPAIDSGHTARFVTERGRAAGLCDVVSAGALTIDRAGVQLAHFDDLWSAGVRLFTDDGDSVADAGVLRRAMEYLSALGGVVAQHAIDPGLARGGQMHEGEVSSRLGMQGIPSAAEETMIARDLALVELTGCRYHVQHLSTAGGVGLIAEAKRSGLPVTAEVTPHHLAFDHRDVAETDPNYKMMPPLRTPDDVESVREAIRDGIIDTLATDHAPHSSLEQDVPFEQAPFGVIGLETAAGVLNTHVGLEAAAFFDRMSVAPARIAELEDHGNLIAAGNVANIAVFDPGANTSVERFRSKSSNSPFLGTELRGAVRTTVYRGAIVSEATT